MNRKPVKKKIKISNKTSELTVTHFCAIGRRDKTGGGGDQDETDKRKRSVGTSVCWSHVGHGRNGSTRDTHASGRQRRLWRRRQWRTDERTRKTDERRDVRPIGQCATAGGAAAAAVAMAALLLVMCQRARWRRRRPRWFFTRVFRNRTAHTHTHAHRHKLTH